MHGERMKVDAAAWPVLVGDVIAPTKVWNLNKHPENDQPSATEYIGRCTSADNMFTTAVLGVSSITPPPTEYIGRCTRDTWRNSIVRVLLQ
jgi:hypothetical protein